MASPLVTLVLPIYNMERFLRESLLSIREQTFPNFEVISILDGCTDRSEEILNELKDERFIVFKKERNEGVGAATNLGLQKARGEFFGRMDADDVMDSERVRKEVEFLRAHPEIDIVGTWFDYIDDSGRTTKAAFPFPTVHEEIKDGFRVRNSIGGPTALYRTERIRALGGFASDISFAEDLTIMLKCLAAGYRFANLPEVLYHYRQHAVQLNRVRKHETLRNTDLAYQKYGPAIWGKDAPLMDLSAPLAVRVIGKFRRAWRRMMSATP
jgi:alpha-1,6-rhamnosyltransferase